MQNKIPELFFSHLKECMNLKHEIESYNLFNLPEQSILPGETVWYLEVQHKKIGKLILVWPLFTVNNLDQLLNELKFKKSKRRYKMSHSKMREPSLSAVIGEFKLENDHSNEIREGDILVLDKKATDPIDIKSKGKRDISECCGREIMKRQPLDAE